MGNVLAKSNLSLFVMGNGPAAVVVVLAVLKLQIFLAGRLVLCRTTTLTNFVLSVIIASIGILSVIIASIGFHILRRKELHSCDRVEVRTRPFVSFLHHIHNSFCCECGERRI